MKQVLVKRGQVEVADVPAPVVTPGCVLVRVEHSCISAGTEMSGIKAGAEPLWKKAINQPEKVRRVFDMVATKGLSHTVAKIQGLLDKLNPTGYSAAGTVLAVGEGVHDIHVGDRVACAGAQCAHHAEVICVPKNLTVRVPDGVSSAYASTVTLGAIALQGVRRLNPTLGETFVVIGLGLLGQLTVQMLKANGCRVIGIDPEDARAELALAHGMDAALNPGTENIDHIKRLTHGHGADGVVITAASPSNEIISTAFNLCRKKGRVVLVGDVGLDLNRADFYTKELDFFISTSYGPGRYDRLYEENGFEYPIAYVRWTETRNMSAYLDLLASGGVKLEKLVTAQFPIDKADAAYTALKDVQKPLLLLLEYPKRDDEAEVTSTIRHNPAARKAGRNAIRVGIVGAGSFAENMHVPNLQTLSKYYAIQGVMSRTAYKAHALGQLAGAGFITTHYDDLVNDPNIDLVMICTPHNTHADMALKALKAGKAVFVEKPLAMDETELNQIVDYYGSQSADSVPPMLMTGFNRRFAPMVQKIKALLENRTNPIMVNYRMNAGYIPLDNWMHGPEGGGRNIGEACHIYDLFTYLTGSKVVDIQVTNLTPTTNHYSARDNFVATISFEDGSVCTLTYTALGSSSYPKEHMEVYADGKVMVLEDYKKLTTHGAKGDMELPEQDKGHKAELEAFAKAYRNGGTWPIELWEQAQATTIANRVEQLLG